MKNILPYLIILLSFGNLYGQNSKTDSLLQEIQKSTSDTNKITLGTLYGKALGTGEFAFWDSLYNSSLETKSPEHIALCTYWKGYVRLRKGLLEEGLELMLTNEQQYKDLKLPNKRANTMAFIGYAYRNLGKNDDAFRYYHWGLDIYEEQDNIGQMVRMVNKLAVMHQELGNSDSSHYYYNLNLEHLENTDRKEDLAQTYGNIGTLYGREGDYIKSVEYVLKAIKIRESTGDWRNISTNYMNLGYLFQRQDEFDEALKYFRKAQEANAKTSDDRGLQEAAILLNIGFVKMRQKKIDEAFPLVRKSLDIRVKAPDEQGIGFSANNMGKLHQMTGDKDSALYYFRWAEKQWRLLNYKQGLVATLHNIGHLELEANNIAVAQKIANESYQIAEAINFPDRKRDAAELLMAVYQKTGNWMKAFEMQTLARTLSDSLKSESIRKSSLQQSIQYKFDMVAAADSVRHLEEKKQDSLKLKAQEAETEHQRVEANYQKKQKNFLYAGLAILAVLLVFIFQRFKVSQKQKAIIETQKKEVEVQRTEAQIQKELVEERNKEILDSITYAKRIQGAILPPDKLVMRYLEESFILYKPKDIVAGDFYWMEPFAQSEEILFAAADCTGHGVPGAMVSVVCNNALNRSVREFGLTNPGAILDKTREIVISEFRSEKNNTDNIGEVKDGMDIALCKLNPKTRELSFSGANNPVWIVRKGEIELEDIGVHDNPKTGKLMQNGYTLLEVKGSKQPIGQFDQQKEFETHHFKLQKGDTVYIFSDGFADQFGGPKGKKLKASNMKKLFLGLQEASLSKQKEALESSFEEWRGDFEQLDDICVIGVRI